MTSHDVVAQLRKITGLKQVGHAGTLDPMARGVLPVALGSACRLIRFLPTDKIYLADVLLGTVTDTDDVTGKTINEMPVSDILYQKINGQVASFIGKQKQRPPLYSAIHHEGKRLYELARAGMAPDIIKDRDVFIEAIEIVAVERPVLKLRIKCSGGTYIRSIARDLGDKLGCGGCLKALIREKSGPFLLGEAWTLETLAELARVGQLSNASIAPAHVLGIEVVSVDREKAKMLALGQYLSMPSISPLSRRQLIDDKLCLVVCEETAIAVCAVTADNRLHPEVVLRNAKSFV